MQGRRCLDEENSEVKKEFKSLCTQFLDLVGVVSQRVLLSKLSRTKKQGVLLHPPVYLVLYYSYSQTMKHEHGS